MKTTMNDKERAEAREKLLPCPFCGTNQHLRVHKAAYKGRTEDFRVRIKCLKCGLSTKQFNWYPAWAAENGGESLEAMVARHWNTREGYAAASSGPGDVCDACGGTGKPVSGLPCICGGTGKGSDEKMGLRKALLQAESSAPAPRQALGGDVEAAFIELQCGENCCHSDAEHKAFDDGYYGRGIAYPDGHLRAIYGIGQSVGKLIR